MENMDDRYEGFNDYEYAYDMQNVLNDKVFQQAVTRSSYGRRPITGIRVPTSTARPTTSAARNMLSSGVRALPPSSGIMHSSAIPRKNAFTPRPLTAVRAAGYTSGATPDSSGELRSSNKTIEESNEEKCRQLEEEVNVLLEESIQSWERSEFKLALEKAKQAGRKERLAVRLREQLSVVEQLNLDLTFTVLLNLAHQYMANDLLTEALKTYQMIVKNKMFTNTGRLKVNIGNIYFKKKDYEKAIKYYRMALDQVPNSQASIRMKILNNIGVAFIKLGEYEEAANTFGYCIEERGDYSTALNLILTAYCLEDVDKMKESFQQLVDIPRFVDDEPKYIEHEDFLLSQTINNDLLKQWERERRKIAEKTILTAAKIISPAIAPTYAEGHAWCVETTKQSVYASLAMELEMNKAIDLLKQGQIEAASQALMVFNNKESKIASIAANNLAALKFLQGASTYNEAVEFCEQSMNIDRYNPNALVNRGNIYFANNDYEKAFKCYKEALSNEATCVQALYNMALITKLEGKLNEALEYFYKLHNILFSNVEVICQLASVYELMGDNAQALELYSQANSLAPTDPSIYAKLANIYEDEGDKSQAFQCYYDSYRYFPSDINVTEWLGAYYIETQFPEKAVSYFEKAAIMQPKEIRWQLMMASCQRRAGNYQKALDLYRAVHKRFPDNIECLKFLIRICTDLGIPEAKDYKQKLAKVESLRQLRMQRATDSSHGSRTLLSSASNESHSTTHIRPNSKSSRGSTSSFNFSHSGDLTYQITPQDIRSVDHSYEDPIGPGPKRPKTSKGQKGHDLQETLENEEIDEDLLPE